MPGIAAHVGAYTAASSPALHDAPPAPVRSSSEQRPCYGPCAHNLGGELANLGGDAHVGWVVSVSFTRSVDWRGSLFVG